MSAPPTWPPPQQPQQIIVESGARGMSCGSAALIIFVVLIVLPFASCAVCAGVGAVSRERSAVPAPSR